MGALSGGDFVFESGMVSTIRRFLWFSAAFVVHSAGMNASGGELKLEAKSFSDPSGGVLPYRWHAPQDIEAGRKYPLVVFLHGAGERGADNRAQLRHGVGDLLAWSAARKEPCFLVAPQCPKGEWWASADHDTMELRPGAAPTPPMKLVMALIDSVMEEHPVDSARLYVTGLSMGGFGTWFLLERMPERIAAAAPVCGGGAPAAAKRFKDVPVWAFHGARDPVVPPSSTRHMIEALRKAGGKPKFTEYPEARHDSWTATYKDPKFLAWMFAQRRKE